MIYTPEWYEKANRELQKELNNPAKRLSYRELQKELKVHRKFGQIPKTFKLNQRRAILAAEYNRYMCGAELAYNEIMSARMAHLCA